jgi:DNA polymerase-3 subunit beta
MIIKAKRESLLTPLQTVIGIVERKQTAPILSNVLLEVKGEELFITANDQEVQIRTQSVLDAKAEEHFITLPGRKLHDILKSLSEGIPVALEGKDNRQVLKAGKSRFSLQTLPGKDFPCMVKNPEEKVVVSLPQKTLKGLLERVQFSMALQDVRYYLNGTLFRIADDQITLVATDGHRLSYVNQTLEAGTQNAEVIIPRKTVHELIKLLSPTENLVKVIISGNQIRFEFDGIELLSKVVDGKFPDFTRVIPTNYSKHLNLQRQEFLQALQRASILSNEKIRGVRLLLTQNQLSILCTNTEQEEAQEDLEVEYGAEAIDIGFNINYLLEVLNHLDSTTVICSLGDANSSILITMPEGDNTNFKYVVMPMRI